MAKIQRFELEAAVRHETGKGASRRLRRQEKVPGVIYGGGKEPMSLTLEHKSISKTLQDEAAYSHILTLNTDGDSEKVILKAVQRHPYKPRIVHVDFQRVRADEKLHMHVPLHFLNADKAPGVKAGGVVTHNVSDVEISCLPADLPEFIEVDLAILELNQTLHLSDLQLPNGVEIVELAHGHDNSVVSVYIPRAEAEPEPEDTSAPTASEVPATAQKSDEDKSK